MNRLPARGTADIKGLNYRDKILDPIPRHATTNFKNFSRTDTVLSYLGIGFIGYELYSNPNYTIDLLRKLFLIHPIYKSSNKVHSQAKSFTSISIFTR